MSVDDMEKAKSFCRAVASRDAGLAVTYVDAEHYVEHNSRVADGVPGLKAFVAGLPDCRMEVVRALQDGGFVVIQSRGNLLGHSVFFDIFRFNQGLITEHWAFSSPGGPPNKSGHTQEDGPTEPQRGADTEQNRAIARAYYETVHLRGAHTEIRRFFDGDRCIRHEPNVADGLPAFMRDLAVVTRSRSIDAIALILAEGDFVFIAARGTVEGRPCVYIDLYRVEAGKIVEHWGFPEDVPPAETWNNDNGML